MEYLDFEIRIGAGAGNDRTVMVLRSPGGEATVPLLLPDGDALGERLAAYTAHVRDLAVPRPAGATPPDRASTEALGAMLFDALFQGPVRTVLDTSRVEARRHGQGLRIKLRTDDAEVASLPWELMHDAAEGEYLCLSVRTPVVRYVELAQPQEPLAAAWPVRVLAMAAVPAGLDQLDVAGERARIEEALRPLRDEGRVELHWVDGSTWQHLQAALRGGPWHVFHFAGHGEFDDAAGEGVLALCDDAGRPAFLAATEVARLLGDHDPLRLAFLNACKGTRSGERDVFASTAASLVRRGLPAVVSMQQSISDAGAIELARSFYGALGDGLPVDMALTEARKAVSIRFPDSVEWAIPVLHLRSLDGRLFALSPRKAAAPVAVATPDGGQIFEALADAPATLAAHLRTREFASLIAERTRRFVGREFIFAAIDHAVADPRFASGYVLIKGEPGIGKTTLLSEYIRRHGCVHHFNIATQNIRSAADFLANTCAQLILRYRLPHTTLPPEATQDGGFLSRLLGEAAADPSNHPVIVAVDALDEAEDVSGSPEANRLWLPQSLPAGVFFVVTTREQHDVRLLVDDQRDIYLRDDDPQNLDDVRAYLTRFLADHRDTLRPALEHWGVDDDGFIEIMSTKSQGNFMYLVHVLRDLERGSLTAATVDRIEDLPNGLRAYYQRHWATMKATDPQEFAHVQLPVVCLLATVREPVSVDQLSEWSKLPGVEVRHVIRQWREFLNEERTPTGEARYRLYHASLADFLDAEEGLRQYHDLMAAAALERIPGFSHAG